MQTVMHIVEVVEMIEDYDMISRITKWSISTMPLSFDDSTK